MLQLSRILSEYYIKQLSQIFEEQNWHIPDETDTVFDRFCSRLAELKNDSDRDFILELTKRYLWVQAKDYEWLLIDALKKSEASNWWYRNRKQGKSIIAPVRGKNERHLAKSSSFMLYLCRGLIASTLPELKGFEVYDLLPDWESVKDNNIERIILVDDYIGSGSTILECLSLYSDCPDFLDRIAIVSLVAQEEGIETISNNTNLNVYCSKIRNKGITDNYPKNELEDRINRMRGISKTVHAIPEEVLGFSNSEGLVTMIRTPNNTFPFFWKERKRSVAPFSRNRLFYKDNEEIINDLSR